MTPRLLIVRAVVASLLLATSLGLASPAQAAPGGASSASAQVGATNAYSRSAFTHTNRARARHDRPALRGNACLRGAAQRQAARMARTGVLEHQDMGRIQRDCGVGYVGENIAVGYPTGRAVVDGWMGSDGHRANILGENYHRLGVAAVKDADGRWWAAQVLGSR